MVAQRGIRVCAWVGIAVGCTGCPNAKITRFDATPRHVCPGDRVELVWDVIGSGAMTVTPATPHAPSGHVADSGTAVIHPMARTTAELQVTRTGGEPTGARVDIEMSQGETMAASIADPSAACRDGTVSSTAHIKNFASDLTVAVVAAQSGDRRAGYDVTHVDERTHQPVTAHVSPTSPTTRFDGVPIVGDWIISSQLSPGESCDSPRLPNNLVVVAYTKCGGEDSHDAR
jgi:hypothetical protein